MPAPCAVYVDRKLSTCSHIFVRHDAFKTGLQKPYDGQHKVLQRTDKYFKINLKGIVDNVSIGKLKPAILLLNFEEHISSDNQAKSCITAQNIRKHKMPFHFTDRSQDNRKPKAVSSTGRITQKSRVIREPDRFHF